MFKLGLELFCSFFKIGTFTLGGGYAMVPLIEDELVRKKKWLTQEDFLEALVIAQSSPGVLAANTAIICGYKVAGRIGTFFGVFASILPSYLIILLLSRFILAYRDSVLFVGFFNGIKPATVALIFVAAYRMGKGAKLGLKNIWIVGIVASVIWYAKISPIIIIILTMVIGNIYYAKMEAKK